MKTMLLSLSLLLSATLVGQTSGNGVIDIDGNHYKTVIIGNQEWMAENLRVKSFNNGDGLNNLTIQNDMIHKASYFDLSENYPNALCGSGTKDRFVKNRRDVYYNYAVIINEKNVCPQNWHIPSIDDWRMLLIGLGGKKEVSDHFKTESYSRKNLAADLKAKKKTHQYTDVRYTKYGGYYEKIWTDCDNCKNWNSEYRSKKACNICRDNRGFEKKGIYIPISFEKHETRTELFSGFNGTNKTGFNLIDSGSLHFNNECVFLETTWVWAKGNRGNKISVSIDVYDEDEISLFETEMSNAKNIEYKGGFIIRCIKD